METADESIVRLLVAGDRACFRRPECTSDLVTYDVMPPTIGRRLLSAALGDDRWRLRRIIVTRPIRFAWDEIVTVRGPRRVLALTDVAYVLEAVSSDAPPPSAIANDRAVHLGLADYPASMTLLCGDELPSSRATGDARIDLGWMVYDTQGSKPTFFRASIIAGAIDVDAPRSALVS